MYLTNTLCAIKSLNPTDLTAHKLIGRRAVRLYEDRQVCQFTSQHSLISGGYPVTADHVIAKSLHTTLAESAQSCACSLYMRLQPLC